MRMQANLSIGELVKSRGIIYAKLAIAQEIGISIVIVLVRKMAWPAQGLEGSRLLATDRAAIL
jgi:predicted phosphoribosyltransferase